MCPGKATASRWRPLSVRIAETIGLVGAYAPQSHILS